MPKYKSGEEIAAAVKTVPGLAQFVAEVREGSGAHYGGRSIAEVCVAHARELKPSVLTGCIAVGIGDSKNVQELYVVRRDGASSAWRLRKLALEGKPESPCDDFNDPEKRWAIVMQLICPSDRTIMIMHEEKTALNMRVFSSVGQSLDGVLAEAIAEAKVKQDLADLLPR